jgi:5-dehydro-2-deoxygluconokinase
MPSWEELRGFLDRPADAGPPGDDRRLNRLHRVTTRRREWEEVHALAFDHRVQFEELADRNGVDRTRISVFKRLVAEGAAAVRDTSGRGAIVDDRYGDAVLASLTGEGWWLARPVEVPKSVPVAFEPGPNIGLALRAWPEEHIAKCLVAYHPDHDAALRREQEDRLLTLFEACAATGHELLVEVIPPDSLASDGTTLPRALTALYARGIFPDWWKLPPATDPATWDAIASVIETHDRYCRGIVVLGLDAPEEELKRSFEAVANQPLCKGFAVGRSIFREAAEAWFAGTSNDEDVIAAVAKNYRRIIQIWRSRADANTYIAG